jgi:hypothetical protein
MSLPRQSHAEMTRSQWAAWATGQALLGGAVSLPSPPGGYDEGTLRVLRRLLPVYQRSARPIDLFEPAGPRIWHLPIETGAGRWDLVGIFNWSETEPVEVVVPLNALGIPEGTYCTVFGFWEEQYHGVAADQLAVPVAPASVRLLGLRRYQNRPMLAASNSHFTQGASDMTKLQWAPAEMRLSGEFEAQAGREYTLYIVSPPPYAPVLDEGVRLQTEGNLMMLELQAEADGPVGWSLDFTLQRRGG